MPEGWYESVWLRRSGTQDPSCVEPYVSPARTNCIRSLTTPKQTVLCMVFPLNGGKIWKRDSKK